MRRRGKENPIMRGSARWPPSAACLTLRDTTERPETVSVGTNELIGTDPAGIEPALRRLFAGDWKKGGVPDKWDGRAGERIAVLLERLVAQPGS